MCAFIGKSLIAHMANTAMYAPHNAGSSARPAQTFSGLRVDEDIKSQTHRVRATQSHYFHVRLVQGMKGRTRTQGSEKRISLPRWRRERP